MPAKKASTAQLKLVTTAGLPADAPARKPTQPKLAPPAAPPATALERAFQAALRAERRIGDVLEVEWKATKDNFPEQFKLCAFALLVHEDRYADLFEAKVWVARFNELLLHKLEEQDASLNFWSKAGQIAAAQVDSRASNELLDACVELVRKGDAPDANAWLHLAVQCVAEANSRQNPAMACALIEMVQAHPQFAKTACLLRIRWHHLAGYGFFLAQSFSDAKQAWALARALLEQQSQPSDTTHRQLQADNLNSYRVLLNVAFARMAVEANELEAAQTELEQVRPLVAGCIANARLLYHHLVSRVALRCGRVLEAQHHLDIAREILRVEYQDIGYVPVVLSEYLQVLFAQERWADAVNFADECKPHFERHGQIYCEFLRLAALTRMWADAQGPNDSVEPFVSTLKEAMDLAVKHDFRALLRSVPSFASWMCAHALEQGIHTEFVREVVASRKLPTPPRAPKEWPWAVWLDLIGPFAITLEGQKLALTGKVAQKPLELIKLLACTKRYTLSLESAAIQLWPEAESLSAARKNLETTIARARKLIGESAIKVGEGRVQLDAALVGSNLQYMLDTCGLAEALASKSVSLAQLNRAARQLSELYEGELLQGDEESLWLISARQYLRNAYVRATLGVATALQGNELQSDEVSKLLEIAISREPIAEQLYTKLMQHYADQGRKAEALHTYRRCKQYLSVIAGLVPSKATELIKERLLVS